jgi:hypothetical protein
VKYPLLSFILCASVLFANEAPVNQDGSLSSTNASYDGNFLTLTGNVSLDHGLGKMSSEEASLQRQEVGNDFPFSQILLRKNVSLLLKNSAQISCARADLDFTALKGSLFAEENGQVVYSDQIKKKKGGEAIALILGSQSIDLNFSKHAQEGKKTEYDIDHILAMGGVAIDYAGNFHLLAHHALYRRALSKDNKTAHREFQGTLTAYPKDETSQCRLSHEGDEIFADMVDIDLLNSKISLLHPKGVLATSVLPHLENTKTSFQSDYLYWDENKNILTLKGHISINEAAFGSLQTQDEVQMTMKMANGKRQLKKVDAKGESTLIYQDAYNTTHKLISHGAVHLDRDKLKGTIDSPEKEGVTPIDKQLYYEETEVAFYADHAALEYAIDGDALYPSLLTLKGNIRLFSHDPLKPLRFGSADRLTYSLTTRTLILSANPGKKVLFWDETQGIRLSAPEVHIVYDSERKEQSVKGIGAVQFSFTPEEQSRLLALFPQLQARP